MCNFLVPAAGKKIGDGPELTAEIRDLSTKNVGESESHHFHRSSHDYLRYLKETISRGVDRTMFTPRLICYSVFLGHDDPEDDVDEGAGEGGGEDGEDDIENADEGGIPIEPVGDAAADSGEDAVVFCSVEGHGLTLCISGGRGFERFLAGEAHPTDPPP